MKYILFRFLLIVPFLLAGCASDSDNLIPVFPKPLALKQVQNVPSPRSEEQTSVQQKAPAPQRWQQARSSTFEETPSLLTTNAPTRLQDTEREDIFQGEPLSINFKDMPLPTFINHIFGDILNVSFTLPEELSKKKDLITLRTEADIKPTDLYYLSVEVLAQYGVGVSLQDGFLAIGVADQVPDEVPLLISGRALPSVPISHRPIFHLIPMHYVKCTTIARWVKDAFSQYRKSLSVMSDASLNSVLLKGDSSLVTMAAEMVSALDQPRMQGQNSIKIRPVYLPVDKLIIYLKDILAAEGFDTSSSDSPVIFVPVPEVNALYAFTANKEILSHIQDWVKIVDTPNNKPSAKKEEETVFFYEVKHTTAESITNVLGKLKSTTTQKTSTSDPTKKDSLTAENQPESSRNLQISGDLILDEPRNTILYSGTEKSWNQLLPIIHQLDKPDRMVLLEVIIAEIRLDDGEELGFNWSSTRGDVGVGTAAIGDGDDGLTVGASGFNFVLDTAGGMLARFNAYAEQQKVSILSTPRLMVKNGTKASIEVGSEVPYISRAVSSSTLTSTTSTGIVSETQYRKTGILFSVKPTIFSGNRVELTLSQEASETTPDETNTTSSPTIFNRQIETTLTLDDGSSILLGGLITTQNSQKEESVPLISKIPLLGSLFKSNGASASRTEMVMLIIPYIVDGDEEARSLTRAYLERLSFGN